MGNAEIRKKRKPSRCKYPVETSPWVERHCPKLDLIRLTTLDVTRVAAKQTSIKPSFYKTRTSWGHWEVRAATPLLSQNTWPIQLLGAAPNYAQWFLSAQIILWFPARRASLHFKQRFIPRQEMASRQDFFPSDSEGDSWKSGNGAGFSTQDSHCVGPHLDNQVLQRDLGQWQRFK